MDPMQSGGANKYDTVWASLLRVLKNPHPKRGCSRPTPSKTSASGLSRVDIDNSGGGALGRPDLFIGEVITAEATAHVEHALFTIRVVRDQVLAAQGQL